MIEVLAGGPLSTIQDRGRTGLRRLGVPTAGALAPAWMTIANALVGNAPDAPIIECFEGGLRLAARERALRVAHVGDADVVLVTDGERRTLAPWRSHRIPAGAELAVRATGTARLAVIAVRGLDVPPVLGSASTYARAGLGGVDGRALEAGDRLATAGDGGPDAEADVPGPDLGGPDLAGPDLAGPELAGPELGCPPFAPATPPDGEPTRLRAVPGPQADAFAPATLDTLFDTVWTLSPETDRMGARLEGAPLRHRDEAARDIVSDAIVPGSVQVPGGGQPIVMLADAHTAGGYPKIATIISVDLARLAVQRPGTRFRLERLGTEAAVAAAREHAAALERHLTCLAPIAADALDTARLLAHNLIDGVTDGSVPGDADGRRAAVEPHPEDDR